MSEEKLPYTPDELRQIADTVEAWSKHLYNEQGDPVLEIDHVVLSGAVIDREGTLGRIGVDLSGAYWGWCPE